MTTAHIAINKLGAIIASDAVITTVAYSSLVMTGHAKPIAITLYT